VRAVDIPLIKAARIGVVEVVGARGLMRAVVVVGGVREVRARVRRVGRVVRVGKLIQVVPVAVVGQTVVTVAL
jgi:hypothetical protein